MVRIRYKVPYIYHNLGKAKTLESLSYKISGLRRISANPYTSNVLVVFDEKYLKPIDILLNIVEAKEFEDVLVTAGSIVEPEELPLSYQIFETALAGVSLASVSALRSMRGASKLSMRYVVYDIAAVVAIIAGFPIFRSGIRHVTSARIIAYDFIMGFLLLITLFMRENVVGLTVLFFINLSNLIKSYLMRKTREFTPGTVYEKAFRDVHIQLIADKYSTKIFPYALTVAVLTGISTRSIARGLSVMLVATPSALSDSVTTSMAAAMGKAGRKGIYLKHPYFIEVASKVDKIVFDIDNIPDDKTIKNIRLEGITDISFMSDRYDPKIEKECNYNGIKYVGDMTEEDKIKYIREQKKNCKIVAVVGDGVKDIDAVKVSDLGFAIKSANTSSMKWADVVFDDEMLYKIPYTIRLSNYTIETVKQGFAITLAANMVGTFLTISGYILPFGASLYHSIISLLMVLNSYRVFLYREESHENKKLAGRPSRYPKQIKSHGGFKCINVSG